MMKKWAAKAHPVPIIVSLKATLKATIEVTHQMKAVGITIKGVQGDAQGISKSDVIVTEYNRNRIAVLYSAVIAPSIMTWTSVWTGASQAVTSNMKTLEIGSPKMLGLITGGATSHLFQITLMGITHSITIRVAITAATTSVVVCMGAVVEGIAGSRRTMITGSMMIVGLTIIVKGPISRTTGKTVMIDIISIGKSLLPISAKIRIAIIN